MPHSSSFSHEAVNSDLQRVARGGLCCVGHSIAMDTYLRICRASGRRYPRRFNDQCGCIADNNQGSPRAVCPAATSKGASGSHGDSTELLCASLASVEAPRVRAVAANWGTGIGQKGVVFGPGGVAHPEPYRKPTGPRRCVGGELLNQVLEVGPVAAGAALDQRDWTATAMRTLTDRGFALGGLTDGRGAAFRHCLWPCRMAQDPRIGSDRARRIGEVHEACVPNPTGKRSMDLRSTSNRPGRASSGSQL